MGNPSILLEIVRVSYPNLLILLGYLPPTTPTPRGYTPHPIGASISYPYFSCLLLFYFPYPTYSGVCFIFCFLGGWRACGEVVMGW